MKYPKGINTIRDL